MFGLVWRTIISSKSKIEGKSDHMGSFMHYLSKKMIGGFRELIYGYPYLSFLIPLWPDYWKYHMRMMNEAVGEWNQHKKEAW